MSEQGALDLCVIGGGGHVGLPLALTFCRAGLRVGIVDTRAEQMELVRSGTMPFLEEGAEELLASVLRNGRLELSTDAELIERSATVILSVGTPIDEFLNPSLKMLSNVIDDVEPHVRDEALLILRSTVYPGVTDWICETLSDRGRPIDVAFCPERIVEGHALDEIVKLPQIVGANSQQAFDRAAELFRLLGVPIIRTTPKEAELAKLFTNSWRYLKFAIANEFFVISQQAGVDYSNVLRAVREDYPRAADLPGPGFAAGPCLLKDTMQLSAFDGHNFVLGHAAMLVNEGLPEHIIQILGGDSGLRGHNVALLGLAFKAGSDDIRDSLSYKLKRLFWFAGAHVRCTDPYVTDPEAVSLGEALSDAEIVVIATPHDAYRGLDVGGRRVVDIWGITTGEIRL